MIARAIAEQEDGEDNVVFIEYDTKIVYLESYGAAAEPETYNYAVIDADASLEAALDEVNVDRFADYLHKNTDRTQFIVITHRRGTMEVADRLYGVTMVERGISTVLSIGANEVAKFQDNLK